MSKKPSKDLCQTLFETVGNAILVLQNGQIVDCNAAACALFNYTKRGLKGKTLLDLSPATQPDGTSSAETFQEKLDTLTIGQPVQFEWLNRDKKRQEIYTEIVLTAAEFEKDTYVQASIYNISKYKEAEDELLDSERHLTDIINFLPEGTFVIDVEGKLIAWNKAMEEMTGIKAEDVLGKGDYEYALPFYGERRPVLADLAMHPSEDIAKNYPSIERDGESYVAEVNTPYFMKEGGAIVRAKAHALYDAHGNIIGAIESVRDITEREQAEDKLADERNLLRTLIDSLADTHIFVKDTENRFLVTNASHLQTLGATLDEVIGKTDFDFFPSDIAQQYTDDEKYVMKSGQPLLNQAEPVITFNGEEKWYLTNKLPLHDDNGEVIGLVGTSLDITERRQAEQRVRQSEQRLRTFVNALPDVAFIQDAEGQYLEVLASEYNPRYNQIENTLKGKNVNDVTSPEQAELFVSTIKRALDTQEGQILEYSIRDNAWYEGRVLPIPVEHGQAEQVVWLARDISDRKQIEQALQQSEQRLADIIEFLPSPTFAIDKEGKVIAWNRACEAALGIEAKDILGKGDYEYALPFYGERRPILIDMVFESAEESKQKYSAIQQEGDTLRGEAVVYPQGQPRYFVGTAAPLYDDEENIFGAIETFRDVTEQKQIETAMRESEQRLSDIIDFLPTPTFVIDREGNVIAWNQAIADVTGVEAEDILGKGNYEYALPFFGKRRPLLIDLIFESEEEIAKNYTNVRRDGTRLFAENRVFPRGIERIYDLSATGLYDSQGNLVGAIENFKDITEQKQAEEELRKYQGQLEEQVESRTTELEERVRELNALQRLMSREGWQDYQTVQKTATRGYLFNEKSVLPVDTVKNGHPILEPATLSKNGHSLTLPVSVYGEIIGTLGVYDDPEHPLDPEEQLFLDSVAEQIAEALERARLLEQTRTALSNVEQSQVRTERLYQANRRLNAAPDLQEAVAAIIEGVSASDIDRAVLIIFERNSTGEIEFGNVVANWHNGVGPLPTPVGTRYPIAVIQTLKFAMSKDPFFFDDTFNDPRVDPGSLEVFRRQDIRAVASLPLWTGDTQLGTLLVESEIPHIFTQNEREPFVSLAAQLTVTVENRGLFEQTQAALAEIEATQRRYTVQAWESYRTRTIKQKYEQTREGVVPLGEELPPEVGEAVARKQAIIKTQQPVLTAGDEITNDSTSIIEGAKSSLAVPLTVRDQIIGVLGLQETDNARDWLPEEIALVEAIAEQMAQAAENIRLLDDTQQRAAREQRVNEIGDKIQGAQSLEEALQIAVKEVGLSLEAPQTKVKLSVD